MERKGKKASQRWVEDSFVNPDDLDFVDGLVDPIIANRVRKARGDRQMHLERTRRKLKRDKQ